MQHRPRFRTDLVAQPVSDAGQRFVDVTDPDSGSTFRFYEVEYAVACAMDGKRDFGGLVSWSQSELGLEPSKQEIETVVTTLEELGYLAASEGEDMLLGASGKSPMTTPREPVSAPDVELGHAGVGPEEKTEVSVDLSQHLSVGAADVKEAVRQSRVMDVAEPDDDEDAETALQGDPISAEQLNKATEEAIAQEVAAEVKKEAVGAKPITIPSKTPSVKKPSPAEVAAAALPKPEGDAAKEPGGGGAMTAVLVVLLLAVLAVGGWYVYTNFIQPSAAAETSEAPATKPAPAAKKKV